MDPNGDPKTVRTSSIHSLHTFHFINDIIIIPEAYLKGEGDLLNPNGKPFFWGIIGSGPQSKPGVGLCDDGLEFAGLFHFALGKWVRSRRRGPASCSWGSSNADVLTIDVCVSGFVGAVKANGATGAAAAQMFNNGC